MRANFSISSVQGMEEDGEENTFGKLVTSLKLQRFAQVGFNLSQLRQGERMLDMFRSFSTRSV